MTSLVPRRLLSAHGFALALGLTCILGIPGFYAAGPTPAPQQAQDRFRRREPGLILETGARRGNCDALTFTPDGRCVLAAGDDKLVHAWPFAQGKLGDDQPLRWPIWREQRGAIYALALSPDADAEHVAVAGFGELTWFGPVVILERASGKIEHALVKPHEGGVIWSLAYSPSGKKVAIGHNDGSVWLWNPASDTIAKDGTSLPANDCRRLGPAPQEPAQPNRVKLLLFTAEDTLLAVVEDGRVLRYDLASSQAAPKEAANFGMTILRAAARRDRKSIAACERGGKGQVKLLSAAGDREARTVPGLDGFRPESLAFDARGERLAVGYSDQGAGGPFRLLRGKVAVFAVNERSIATVAGPVDTSLPQALAFHPKGTHLAVAGNDNYEVIVWDLGNGKEALRQTARKEGDGRCAWGVALSKDGQFLAILDEPEAAPQHPNHRGKAPKGEAQWPRVFDLKAQGWGKPEDCQDPVPPRDALPGWKVQFDKTDAYKWYVVGPKEQVVPLPWNRDQDDKPLCYTFLKAVDGKPVRLAVGHYWGFSLFELSEDISEKKPPRRVKLFTGHDGEVVAIAPSANEKLLVTASRDQTVAAWSLADWPSQPALGAEFKEVNGVPRVVTVDPGSPAWEAGLKEGDEIRLLQIEGVDFVFDPDGKSHRNDRATAERLKTLTTDVRRCLARLSDVTPGKEYLFGMKRGDKFVHAATRVKQRPLWRLFATRPDRGNEWVLWGWRDYYYDTSTHGDRYVGWLVCDERDTVRPDFYRADQLAKRFYDRDKVQQFLEGGRANPDEVAVPQLEPPAVAVLADSDDLNARDAVVTFTATARDDSNLQKLDEARLWVNDHLFKTWPEVNAATFDSGRVVIPQGLLRLGDNVIVLHCFNAAGARAELAVRVHFQDPKRPRKPNLYGLAVGVNVYKDRVKAPGITNLACAEQDAQAFRELWSPQAKNRYDQVDVRLLAEEKATRTNILVVLDDFKKLQAKGDLRPDDTLVLFFAGHGLSLRDDKGRYKPGSYVYVCPGFNDERPTETGLDSKTLYKQLSELNCRKLVFLDTCHAGALDPVRDLRSDGMGPFVLASCLPHETSGEVAEIGHGFFTQVLLDGLGDGLEADANEDGNVDVRELCDYVKRYVPNLATRNKKKGSQNPQYSPQMPGREVLVSRVKDS